VRRAQLSYANVMSTIAVFIALGGTSYAVARNSIGTTQLKNNAVTSAKVRNGSLKRGDLASSARVGERGPRGPQGPAGGNGVSSADLAPESWKGLDYTAGWGDYGAPGPAGAFRKDKLGEVHLRGIATRGGPDVLPTRLEVIATLPPGYRPQARIDFETAGGNGDTAAQFFIDPDGTMVYLTGSPAEKDYISFTGIAFSTD
jgi:hypothetical protein